MIKRKQAELSSGAIVGLILLVLGAVVILIVYGTMNWKGVSNREVCHASVIMRGSLSSVNSLSSGIVPLNCKSKKICIGGKCKEDYEKTEKVVRVSVKNKQEIEKLLSRELLDCWMMMGEGKLSLFSDSLADYGLEVKTPHCFICDKIYFDKQYFTKEKIKEIGLDNLDVINYMTSHKPKELDKSYYEYLGGKVNADSFLSKFENLEILGEKKGITRSLKFKGDSAKKVSVKNPTESMAIVFSQIITPTKKDVLIGDAYFVGGVGAAKILTTGLPSAFTAFVGAVVGAVLVGAQMASVNTNRYLTAGYCGSISSGEKARQGCSMVQIIPYNAEELSKRCGYFEGVS